MIFQKCLNMLKRLRVRCMSKGKFTEYLRKSGMKIGDGCDIHKSIVIGSEPWLVSIGKNVRITRNVQFITHDGSLWTLRKMGLIDENAVYYNHIVIGDNCNIGWNVILMPGIRIGNNCIIGAGAIVTKDIPDNSVAVGIPAHVIESVYDYAEKKRDKTVPTNHMTQEEKRNYLKINKPELFEFD